MPSPRATAVPPARGGVDSASARSRRRCKARTPLAGRRRKGQPHRQLAGVARAFPGVRSHARSGGPGRAAGRAQLARRPALNDLRTSADTARRALSPRLHRTVRGCCQSGLPQGVGSAPRRDPAPSARLPPPDARRWLEHSERAGVAEQGGDLAVLFTHHERPERRGRRASTSRAVDGCIGNGSGRRRLDTPRARERNTGATRRRRSATRAQRGRLLARRSMGARLVSAVIAARDLAREEPTHA